MPVESAADRLAFLNSDEFGTTGTFTGLVGAPTINGIFDEDAELAGGRLGIDVQSSNPVFACRTADLPQVIPDGAVFLTGGISYLVRNREHDGTGMTLMQLEHPGNA